MVSASVMETESIDEIVESISTLLTTTDQLHRRWGLTWNESNAENPQMIAFYCVARGKRVEMHDKFCAIVEFKSNHARATIAADKINHLECYRCATILSGAFQ